MNYESNCCGAPIILVDICNACREHCEAIEVVDEDQALDAEEKMDGDFSEYFDKEILL